MSNGEFGPEQRQLATEIDAEISADVPAVGASAGSDGAGDRRSTLGDVVGPETEAGDRAVIGPPGPLKLSSVTADGGVSAFFRLETPTGTAGELSDVHVELEVNGRPQDIAVTGVAGSAADVVLVFDDAGGMYEEIVGAHAAIGDVVERLSAAGVDARFALITTKGSTELRRDFTADREAIVAAVEGLSGSLGVGRSTPGIASLGVATGHALDFEGRTLSPFRPGAHRVVVSVTDAPALVAGEADVGREVDDPDGLRRALRAVTLLEVADRPTDADGAPASPFAPTTGGTFFERTGASAGAFASLLSDEVVGLLSDTYVATAACDDADAAKPVRLTVDDPDAGTLSATGIYGGSP